jgi:hypothetical protein
MEIPKFANARLSPRRIAQLVTAIFAAAKGREAAAEQKGNWRRSSCVIPAKAGIQG